jgi:hypothetical protein
MKKIFFSGLFIALTAISHSQCLQTFTALSNGGGGTATFPGFGSPADNYYQAPDVSYQISGQVQVSFTSPLPNGTSAPAILTVNQSNPNSVAYAYKFAFASISSDRKSAVYNFYSKANNQNLPNGAQVLFAISIQYLGQEDPNTCLGVLNAPPPITLPVRFSSFNASRTSDTKVSITWTTATEQNSKGFYVQKNVNGEWKDVAFVFSQTENGNSTSALTYSFNDNNTDKGISQYRIQQVDMDGKVSYSDIRAIRNEAITSKVTVYPNPTTNGKLNVVFEDNNGLRDVIVNDMQGKLIKSFKNIANNILVIDKLSAGFYTIKITNRTTNASLVQKVMVKS